MGDVVSGWSGSFNVFIKKFVPFVRKCLNIYCSPQRAGETVFFYLTFLGGIRMFKGSLNKDRRKKRHFYSINTILCCWLCYLW